jgi:N-acetylglucosamine kinase-like BadF-type ATPase
LELPEAFFRRRWEHIYFYGAGCANAEKTKVMESSLVAQFKTPVTVESDLLGAARGLLVKEQGLACILGTGSNSCYYDGEKVVKNVRPLGFILGDEGSGVSLGRTFLSDFVKGLLPAELEASFVKEFGLDYTQIVRKVYKEPAASAFMASLAPFILSHKDDLYVQELLEDCLESLVKRALVRYADHAKDGAVNVGVVGSFGCACEDMLREIGARYGLNFVKFIKSPIDELVTYHTA